MAEFTTETFHCNGKRELPDGTICPADRDKTWEVVVLTYKTKNAIRQVNNCKYCIDGLCHAVDIRDTRDIFADCDSWRTYTLD
ncbi:hypothetical protein KKC94_05920 [Patescibacteria group bacterium]|nr:hypothetical protein [Patescibacteria group bacterium]